MKPTINQAVMGGGAGSALGVIVVMFLPKLTDITLDATEASLLTAAFGVVFSWLIRYLPKPRGGVLGVILLGVVLSACAGAVPWNPQGSAGMTEFEVRWCESKDGAKDSYICGAEFRDGKEKKFVELDIKTPQGLEVRYQAKDVLAFRAHEVRAAVERAVSNDVKEAAPGIVDGIVNAIVGVLRGF